jgi:alpha-glucosidase (family GH31 glycosyl hydrolase)
MDGYRDFTYDPQRYPVHEVQRFKKKLKERDQKYVLIVDPGIKIDSGLKSYDEGLAMDIFVKNPDGTNMIGSVWPGLVHFRKTQMIDWRHLTL